MLTRDQLYGVIRSLDDAINTLNYKFNEDFDRDDPDELITPDSDLDAAIEQVHLAAIQLQPCHSRYHPEDTDGN